MEEVMVRIIGTQISNGDEDRIDFSTTGWFERRGDSFVLSFDEYNADSGEIKTEVIMDGNACVCGDACVCGAADYLYIKGIGSQFRGSTAYRAKDDGIGIVCGCFSGNLDEFEQKVRQTHGENKFAQEYQLFIEIIKLHFGREAEK